MSMGMPSTGMQNTGMQTALHTSPLIWEFCKFIPLAKLGTSLKENVIWGAALCVTARTLSGCQKETSFGRFLLCFHYRIPQVQQQSPYMSLIILCVSSVFRLIEIIKHFLSRLSFSLSFGNPSAALGELLISLSSAHPLHQLLSLVYSFSLVEALSCSDLSVCQETILKTLYHWPTGRTYPLLPHCGRHTLDLDSLL